MNRIYALLLCLLITTAGYAQKQNFLPPDYEEIKAKTTDKGSVYHYPALLQRYKANDTTLQQDEYKYLYYGALYNLDNKTAKESVRDDLAKLLKADSLTATDKRKAIELAQKILDAEPFDLKKINLINNLYMSLGDTPTARPYFIRLSGVIRTILASGNGFSKETGYHVRAVPDEYLILSVLGYGSAGQTLLYDPPTDRINLTANKDNEEFMYFNVTQVFDGYNDMFKDVKLTVPKADKKKK